MKKKKITAIHVYVQSRKKKYQAYYDKYTLIINNFDEKSFTCLSLKTLLNSLPILLIRDLCGENGWIVPFKSE